MNCFSTRYKALKAYPNAIVRKLLKSNSSMMRAGEFVVFNDHTTYQDWKQSGHVS